VQAWELQCEVCTGIVSVKEWRLNDFSYPRHGVGLCKREILKGVTHLQLIESQRLKKLLLGNPKAKSYHLSIK